MGRQRQYTDPCQLSAITPRQAEIAWMVARGMANGDIARELYLSRQTVKNILAQACEKLGVHDRVALAILLKASGANVPASIGALCPREREVAELVTQGFSNKEISGQLEISHGTVKHHVSSIFKKLGLSGNPEARIGLVLIWQRKAGGN